jgi:hypothetical protein
LAGKAFENPCEKAVWIRFSMDSNDFTSIKSANMIKDSGFLAANVPPTYYSNSDDQPLFFDFPFRFIRGN